MTLGLGRLVRFVGGCAEVGGIFAVWGRFVAGVGGSLVGGRFERLLKLRSGGVSGDTEEG